MRHLLDTNVVSEWTKPRPNPGVIEWLSQVAEDDVFLSVVTFAELRHGIERLPSGRRRRRLDEWLRGELALRFEARIVLIDGAIAEDQRAPPLPLSAIAATSISAMRARRLGRSPPSVPCAADDELLDARTNLGTKPLAARHGRSATEHEHVVTARTAAHAANMVDVHQAGAVDLQHRL